ncbi:recombinase family protein [Streptosporangiaceae bacterium NEAU-GS5]|nr:recombinase family protein [Streptosporangiaceae bacterium NEAU-GS5]
MRSELTNNDFTTARPRSHPASKCGQLSRAKPLVGTHRYHRRRSRALSGAKSSRPKFDLVMQLLREGDTLKVTRLDRLGRSMVHLANLGAELRERGIGLHVIEQGSTRRPLKAALWTACSRSSPSSCASSSSLTPATA